jgi:hypothetical protein
MIKTENEKKNFIFFYFKISREKNNRLNKDAMEG